MADAGCFNSVLLQNLNIKIPIMTLKVKRSAIV